jgi:hypothetical protein
MKELNPERTGTGHYAFNVLVNRTMMILPAFPGL